jgi:hypothetical protein
MERECLGVQQTLGQLLRRERADVRGRLAHVLAAGSARTSPLVQEALLPALGFPSYSWGKD